MSVQPIKNPYLTEQTMKKFFPVTLIRRYRDILIDYKTKSRQQTSLLVILTKWIL